MPPNRGTMIIKSHQLCLVIAVCQYLFSFTSSAASVAKLTFSILPLPEHWWLKYVETLIPVSNSYPHAAPGPWLLPAYAWPCTPACQNALNSTTWYTIYKLSHWTKKVLKSLVGLPHLTRAYVLISHRLWRITRPCTPQPLPHRMCYGQNETDPDLTKQSRLALQKTLWEPCWCR